MAKIMSFQSEAAYQPETPSLAALFADGADVWIGDRLKSFYLDERSVLSSTMTPNMVVSIAHHVTQVDFHPKRTRVPSYCLSRKDTKQLQKVYLELVYEAHKAGYRTLLLDYSIYAQKGIDQAMELYRDRLQDVSHEDLYQGLFRCDYSAPMDAVVLQAAALNMNVRAINDPYLALTGLATIYRESKGVTQIPVNLSPEEKVRYYFDVLYAKDLRHIKSLLRGDLPKHLRKATATHMERMVAGKEQSYIDHVLDENVAAFYARLYATDEPYMALFQASRLFCKTENLQRTMGLAFENRPHKTVQMIGCDKEYAVHPQHKIIYEHGHYRALSV